MVGAQLSVLTSIFGRLSCRDAFDCNLPFDRTGGVVLWLGTMVYMFRALGTICEEYFVPALETLVKKLKLSPDVGGATFMAAGSSAPELFTSWVATFLLVNEAGIGTIIGSAIFNILVINGITVYVACEDGTLAIWWYPLLRDCTFYAVAVLELLIFISDGQILWFEGPIMVLTYLVYCLYLKFNTQIMDKLGIEDPEGPPEIDDGGYWQWGRCEQGDVEERPGSPTAPPELGHRLHPIRATELCKCRRCKQNIKKLEVHLACKGCNPSWTLCGRCFEVQQRRKVEEYEKLRLAAIAGNEGELAPEATLLGLRAGTEVPPEPPKASRAARPIEDVVPGQVPDSGTAAPRPASAGHELTAPQAAADRSGRWPRRRRGPGAGDDDTEGEDEAAAGVPARGRTCCPCLSGRSEVAAYQEADVQEVVVGSPAAPGAGGSSSTSSQKRRRPAKEWEGLWPALLEAKEPFALAWRVMLPSPSRHYWSLAFLSAAFVGLLTYMMVDAAMRLGEILRISSRVIGLVFLAVGTSIPDAFGSIAVAKSGEGDMSVANTLGSNVFDILIGLGVPWSIKSWSSGKVDFQHHKVILTVDVLILAGILAVFVGALAMKGWKLTRSVGVFLLSLHLAYVLYVLVTGVGNQGM